MRRLIETYRWVRGRFAYGCCHCPARIQKGEEALCYSVTGDDRTFRYCRACVEKDPGLKAKGEEAARVHR